MLCSTLVLVAIPSRILFHRSHFFHFHSDRGQCVYMHSANCTVERNGIPDISEITVIPLFLDTFITLSLSLSLSSDYIIEIIAGRGAIIAVYNVPKKECFDLRIR